MEKENNKIKVLKWLSIFLAIFFITGIFLLSAYLLFEKKYVNKIYPKIYIGNIEIGGLTKEEALKKLNQKIDQINQDGIIFTYDYYQATLLPIVSSVETDLTYQLFDLNIAKTIDEIYKFGREKNFTKDTTNKINTLLHEKHFGIFNSFNEDEIQKFLVENFSRFETPAQNAELVLKERPYNSSPYEYEIIEEKYGQGLDYNKGLKKLRENLNTLSNASIELEANVQHPIIYKKDCLNMEAQAIKLLNRAPITLNYKNKDWTIYKPKLAEWLQLKTKNDNGQKIYVGLSSTKIQEYLSEIVGTEINQTPVEAKFDITEGKVTEFQISEDGIELNTIESFSEIENIVLNSTSTEVELNTKILKSKATTDNINELGIKEIIGTGSSKFTGSPSNRRHNIQTGADTLNGLLIKPDEEFSLITALGDIDKESGYLPELVIKDNKTIPEYGGGLCQIGTTLFRTVLAAGLEVTMRRNHSYRVSYYEPAGTDATIYDPWPDFKFKNDTNKHILIQTHIDGDDIWFDFWGTNDGRVATTTYPTIYNIKKPAPTKIIETTELEPGVKRCTEHAHNGADAYFDYTVTYPDRETHEERFSSHYVPWREVCLLGVESLSTSTEEKIE